MSAEIADELRARAARIDADGTASQIVSADELRALAAMAEAGGWQPVFGYEGKYEVSREGQVREISTGRVLGQWPNSQGYLLVRLSEPRAMARVHRLVAQAFKPNPLNYPVVNHIDNDTRNNCAANLEWCEQAQNLAHMDAQGRRSKFWLGKRSPNAVFAEDTVRAIRTQYASGCASLSTLARAYGVSKRAIHRCVNGETYADVQ